MASRDGRTNEIYMTNNEDGEKDDMTRAGKDQEERRAIIKQLFIEPTLKIE